MRISSPFFSLTLCLLILHGAEASAAGTNQLRSMELRVSGAETHLEIEGSLPPTFTTSQEEGRLIVDLFRARLAPSAWGRMAKGTIRSVHNEVRGGDLRVVVEFERGREAMIEATGARLRIRIVPGPGTRISLAQATEPAEGAARAAAIAKEAPMAEAADRAAAAEEEARIAEEAARAAAAAEEARIAEGAARAAAAAEEARIAEEAARAAAAAEEARIAEEAARAAAAAEEARIAEEAARAVAAAEEARIAEEAARAAAAAEEARIAEEAARAAAAEEARIAEEAARAAAAAEEARIAKEAARAVAAAEEARIAKEAARAAAAAEEARLAEEAERAAEEADRIAAAAAASRKAAQLSGVGSERDVPAPPGPGAAIARVTAAPPRPPIGRASAAPIDISHVGFRQGPDSVQVTIHHDAPASYRIAEVGGKLVLELENSRISTVNGKRPIDASFFGTSVGLIRPIEDRTKASVRVEIGLRRANVPYSVNQDDGELILEFPR